MQLFAPISYLWRLLATGFCFLVFWWGGLLVGTVVVPLVALLTRDPDVRTLRCRKVVHGGMGLFLQLMQWTLVLKVTVEGRDRLREAGGVLVVANHPTLIDFIAIVALLPEANCIVKAELAKSFYVKQAVSWAGYIVNQDPEFVIDSAVADIKRQRPIVIFPEGSRSPRGELRPFRRGSAVVVAETDCPVIPVVITMDPPTLMKGQSWYEIPPRQAHLRLRVQPPEHFSQDVDPDAPRTLRARKVSGNMRTYFEEQLFG